MNKDTKPEIEVRHALTEDFENIFKLVLAMVKELKGQATAKIIEKQLKREVSNAIEGNVDDVFFVAITGSTMVGCGRARVLDYHPMLRFQKSTRYGYIEMMYILPEWRNMNIGSALLKSMETWLKKLNIECAMLHHSPQTRSFYKYNGYIISNEMIKQLGPKNKGPLTQT